MKLKHIMVALLALAASHSFAQDAVPVDGAAPSRQIPSAIPAAPVTAADVSPPIPVVRDLVNGMVDEQQAVILTPDQIEKLKKTTGDARRAGSFQYPNQFVAKPVARSIQWKPSVLQQPRMVRLAAGTISTLVFSDDLGNPWFVRSTSFDSTLFDDGSKAQQGGAKQSTNIVNIWPLQPYAYGNIVVQLEGMPTPIIFMLSTGQSEENDISLDVRVEGKNPNAPVSAVSSAQLPEHDSAIRYFLDGMPPKGAKQLIVDGGRAEAWSYNDAMYVRTTQSVLSPAFVGHAGSAQGIHVYKFFSLIPQLMLSDAGKSLIVQVSGY